MKLSSTQKILNILVLAVITAMAPAVYATVGFYSGSFDPPTKAHEAIIRIAAEETDLKKIYILVNVTGNKNFNASTFERIEMLKGALSDLGPRVQFSHVLQESKDETIEKLSDGDKSLTMIGEDSYKILPDHLKSDRSRSWIVFERQGVTPSTDKLPPNFASRKVPQIDVEISSSLARNVIGNPDISKYLSSSVIAEIKKENLYITSPDENIRKLQEDLYYESFKDFKSKLVVTFPEIDFSELQPSKFKDTQSSEAWAESFIRNALKKSQLNGKAANTFWEKATSLAFSFPRRQPKAKVSFAKFIDKPIVKENTVISKKLDKLDAIDHTKYNLDVKAYAAERYPESLVKFATTNHISIYVHEGLMDETIDMHMKEGFTQFYSVDISRAPEGAMGIAYSRELNQYRLLLAGISYKDRLAQVKTQLSAAGFKAPITIVSHKNKRPLFTLTTTGKKLKLGPKDKVIIGFKNRISWFLPDLKSWTVTPVTSSGLDMTVYSKDNKKILLVKNMYGDEMQTTLNYLKVIGGVNFIYLGTAGGLGKNINLGDVLLPDKIKFDAKELKFRNSRDLLGDLQNLSLNFVENTTHGWVQTLLTETDSFLYDQQKSGILSLDIETKYLAEFASQNPDIKVAAALIVSDLPLGSVTYDKHDEHMDVIDKAVKKIVPKILEYQIPTPASKKVRFCSEIFAKAG